jgi:hypothetical protein
MSVGGALKKALVQLYEQSWRLIVLNLVVAGVAALTVIAVVTSETPVTLLLLAVVGPFAAALMHCAVTLRQTGRLRLRDGVEGLRLHWRRGLALGAVTGVVALLAVTAVSFWSSHGILAWPLAVLAIYLALMFAVWQIHLWPLAVAGPPRLGDVFREAAAALARRPLGSCGLALALLLVNAVGAIGILPVLSFTVAYSALAVAHFALPPPTEEAAA